MGQAKQQVYLRVYVLDVHCLATYKIVSELGSFSQVPCQWCRGIGDGDLEGGLGLWDDAVAGFFSPRLARKPRNPATVCRLPHQMSTCQLGCI